MLTDKIILKSGGAGEGREFEKMEMAEAEGRGHQGVSERLHEDGNVKLGGGRRGVVYTVNGSL